MWQGPRPPAARKLLNLVALTRASRPILPLLSRSALFRRAAMRDNAVDGARMSRAQFLGMVDDLLGCQTVADLLTSDEACSALEPDCPVTIAWSERDRILPLRTDGAVARERVPHARFVVLPNVGHVPMLDDAPLVADTILSTTQRGQAQSAV